MSKGFVRYLQKRFPKMPPYVIKDFVLRVMKEDLVSPRDVLEYEIWRLHEEVGHLEWIHKVVRIHYGIFEPQTQERLLRRDGGRDPGFGIPRDAERHAVQRRILENGPSQEPIILLYRSNGWELVEGWHRTIQSLAKWPEGYDQPAWVGI